MFFFGFLTGGNSQLLLEVFSFVISFLDWSVLVFYFVFVGDDSKTGFLLEDVDDASDESDYSYLTISSTFFLLFSSSLNFYSTFFLITSSTYFALFSRSSFYYLAADSSTVGEVLLIWSLFGYFVLFDAFSMGFGIVMFCLVFYRSFSFYLLSFSFVFFTCCSRSSRYFNCSSFDALVDGGTRIFEGSTISWSEFV